MADAGYPSPLQPNSDASRFTELAFVVSQLVGKIATLTLCEVMAVTPGSDLKIGTVDVKPAVNQVDGALNGFPHGTIYGLPYSRVQGGANAVICDPVVGDIGLVGFCLSDISVVKSTQAAGNPGSRRRYDWADGVYLFTVIGKTAPTSYVQIVGDVITILNPTKITLQAPTVHVEGDMTVSGSIVADGDVTGNGVSLHDHTHSGVTTGSSDTGPPT